MSEAIKITAPMISANSKKKDAYPTAVMTTGVCTPWFVPKAEYEPLQGMFEFLICGQRAFGEVYRAIAHAQKSVSIICWGFQPSMYFIRGGGARRIDDMVALFKVKTDAPPPTAEYLISYPVPIGELLRQKARAGVEIRVLCWGMELEDLSLASISGENNMPNRGKLNRAPNDNSEEFRWSHTDQNRYDEAWWDKYDRQKDRGSTFSAFFDDTIKKLKFYTRGFSLSEHNDLRKKAFDDKEISAKARILFSGVPTHHQKMVLVDYELPNDHVGFVMGHNMLDMYWDTTAHSYLPQAPERGRNGILPREDLSSRVTGPIVGNLFKNFAQAWKLETKEALSEPNFTNYPLEPASLKKASGANPKAIYGHIIRTQSQYGVEDIKKTYLNALNNATLCIYVENQYFRWNPFADKLKDHIQKLIAWGRNVKDLKTPGHGPVYLFVVTNSSEDGMGAGAKKTLEMMQRLGRADTMPAAAKQEKVDDLESQIKINTHVLNGLTEMQGGGYVKEDLTEQINKTTARQNALQAELEKVKNEPMTTAENITGLQVHICTLVPPDTPKGYETRIQKTIAEQNNWDEVYVHSKLMIVDDTFMTLGSTNINTRSMQVDTELNLAHYNPDIAKPARRDLWQIHTAGQTGNGESYKVAFDKWDEIIKRNREREAAKQQPMASLRGFLRHSNSLTNMD